MGLRYKIPFKDNQNTNYEVLIYRDGYNGVVTELTGAPSCFVVSGTDEDFIYTPIRTSTATISVLDSELLLDLYSINSQYSKVVLLKDDTLEWTGYIKPEQFTQPYRPYPQTISIECISALSTLEHIEYKTSTETGFISAWDLLRNLILSANGSYRGVYIPSVYGRNATVDNYNVLEDLEVNEDNFTTESKNSLEVLEDLMKLMNWTITEMHGYIYIVDSDWKGNYKLYDEALTGYSLAGWNEVNIQDVGYNGSDVNVLDVVPGYNKASVKSVNNVFDEVIEQEDYDTLEVAQRDFYTEELQHWNKQFLRPQKMKMYYYKSVYPATEQYTQQQIEQLDINTEIYGATLMKFCYYKDKIVNGEQVPDVEKYDWVNCIQMSSEYITNTNNGEPMFTIYGANSVWKDGALAINMSIVYTTGIAKRLYYTDFMGNFLRCKLKIGEYCWNGTSWKVGDHYFTLEVLGQNKDNYNTIKSNKNPDMPYDSLNGHIIELPTEFAIKGKLEFTLYYDGHGGDAFTPGARIKDLRIEYAKRSGEYDEGENGDRLYENVVNEDYMSECNEIIFDLGSYNKDGATYSKALFNGVFLQDQMYCLIINETIRPEELMIRRIVNRYGVTKIKLTEALRMTSEINPLTIVKERTQPEKSFIVTSGTWDYQQCKLTIQMQEDA